MILLIAKIQLCRIEFDGAAKDLDAIVGYWAVDVAILDTARQPIMHST